MKIPCDAIQNNISGIYIIRNLINNKVYIGQSNDIKRRWQEHIRSGQPDKYAKKSIRDNNAPIHRAMFKYGIDNFDFDILEKCSKDQLNEKEKYWINIFKSNKKELGYNLTEGGQKNFALRGEKHSQAKLTQKEVNEIILLLQTTDLSFGEISKKYHNISNSSLCMINTGKTWYNKNIKYPIRQTNYGSKGSKNPRSKFTEEQVIQIRTMNSQGIKPKDIIPLFKHIATDNAIKAIIYGQSYKHLPIWINKEKKWIEPCIDYSQG